MPTTTCCWSSRTASTGFGETNVFAQTWLPLLEAGGVGLQVCPIFVELERQPEGTLREALGQVGLVPSRRARERGSRRGGADAIRPRSRRARRANRPDARARGRRAVRLRGLGRRLFWELGLRMAGLTWNRRNPYADGAADDGRAFAARPLAACAGSPSAESCSTWRTPREALRRVPRAYEGRVCITHAGCHAVNDHPRNVTDRAAPGSSPTATGSSG